LQQAPGLVGAMDVAREQNHSSRLPPFQQRTQARRHFDTVKANDQKLPKLFYQKFLRIRRFRD
jgi:hypothetical protein